jgi:DNA-binding MarR family transcriptional regulator
MSTPRLKATVPEPIEPPFIGALLRFARRNVLERLLKALVDAGFGDIGPSHFSVLGYPTPEGCTPTELAERTGMTKQAMNYTLGQLEELGYIRRKSKPGRRTSTVHLTARGQRAIEVVLAAGLAIETELRDAVGAECYRDFRAVLQKVAGLSDPQYRATLEKSPDDV